ncbi:MAG TPA: phage portal protein [Gemmata sp.]
MSSDEAFEALGLGAGGKAVSGVRVTRNKALGYPAVWRAVSLISGDVGKLPLVVYRQSGKNKEADPKHPAYRLLLRKPNDAMTAFVFKQTLMLHVLLHGNGYAYIDREGDSRVKQLLILDPEAVEPIRIGGVLWYLYQSPNGEEWRKLPADEVLHIKGLGYDGLQGYPVLKVARDALGAAIAARDHSARYFANGARPGGVLEHPGKLSDPARLRMRGDWERIHKGLENAHKVAILEEGAKYVGFTSNAREAQLLETREFDAREVANIFGVPTHKLGDPSKVAYNSLGEENQSYYDDTLSRWLKVFAEECHDKLLAEKEKASESHCVDFDYQEIQRANLPAQVDFVDKLFRCGIINQDEGRAVFGFNPLPGKAGNQFFIPNTLVTVEEASNPPPEPSRKAVPEGIRSVVADVAGRMARRLATHAEKAARGDLNKWLTDGIAEHNATITEAFGPVVLACRDFGLSPLGASAVAALLIGEFAAKMRAGHASPATAAAEIVLNTLFSE